MKKILLFIFLLFFCFEAFSQSKSQRRIYLWDVTLSMKGYQDKTPDIYDNIVDFLKREINSLTDESTEVVVLPFQEKILENWTVRATEEGKKEIINRIIKYNNDIVTGTNIVQPIKEIQQRLIKNDKRNMLFLLTDGKQTGGNKDLLSIIRNWEQYAKINDAYAVYVMLTKGAEDEEVVNAINQTNDIEVIREPGEIDWIDLQPAKLVKFNIKDDNGKPANIALICKKNIALPENIKVRVSSMDNPYVMFDETVVIKNSNISFKLTYNYQQLRDSLSEMMSIPIRVELQNQEEIKKNTKKIILLSPNDLELQLINKPEKTLKINVKK